MEPTIALQPTWPLPDTFCYVFKSPLRCTVLASQPEVPQRWSVEDPERDIGCLTETLSQGYRARNLLKDLVSPDRDDRVHARMKQSNARIFVRLSPLPETTDELRQVLHRAGNRAWFDECARAISRYDADCGIDHWSDLRSPRAEDEANQSGDLSDSYYALDHSAWGSPQQERAASLLLPPKQVLHGISAGPITLCDAYRLPANRGIGRPDPAKHSHLDDDLGYFDDEDFNKVPSHLNTIIAVEESKLQLEHSD
ncbi:hypothetical protein AURDEDRAFT_157433 [Auricularia subglabra TFB-10046 SS5]|nr:hypothetical protein AURDEDRAFT_157433 [Auricularia subglabra TFB-10046 SS5]